MGEIANLGSGPAILDEEKKHEFSWSFCRDKALPCLGYAIWTRQCLVPTGASLKIETTKTVHQEFLGSTHIAYPFFHNLL